MSFERRLVIPSTTLLAITRSRADSRAWRGVRPKMAPCSATMVRSNSPLFARGAPGEAPVDVVVGQLQVGDAGGVEGQPGPAPGHLVEAPVVGAHRVRVVVERGPGGRGADDVVGG